MGTRGELTASWPLFGLELRTPRLRLNPLCDDDLAELIAVARRGVHDPAVMPFASPWTDAPPDELPGNVLRYFWRSRAAHAPENWMLHFVVRHGGEVLGIQELMADRFAVRRVVGTGSWLGRSHQGRGYGIEMRCAVLMFAFDELGAVRAETEAFADNPASLGVTQHLGYQPNGDALLERRPGEVAENQRFVVTAETFRRPDWSLAVAGLQACRAELGAA